jgi:hypothetical protein
MTHGEGNHHTIDMNYKKWKKKFIKTDWCEDFMKGNCVLCNKKIKSINNHPEFGVIFSGKSEIYSSFYNDDFRFLMCDGCVKKFLVRE